MDFDLPPKDWKSDREKPREPFWGPGAAQGLGYAVSLFATMAILYWLRH
jgi:hypothetical protein